MEITPRQHTAALRELMHILKQSVFRNSRHLKSDLDYKESCKA